MKKTLIITGILSVFFAAHGELVRGTVRDEQGSEIAGALVMLKNRAGARTYTDDQGVFSLLDDAGVSGRNRTSGVAMHMTPVVTKTGVLLKFDGSGNGIALDIFTISGKRVYSAFFENRLPEDHALKLDRSATGLFFMRMTCGSQQRVYKVAPGFSFQVSSLQSQSSSGNRIIAKKAAVVDTLIVISRQHRHVLKGIESYSEENIEIQMAASNPWIPSSDLEYSGGMVKIRAQGYDFEMGQPDPDIEGEGFSYIEQPVHTVIFTYDFWMDTTEVSQGDYDELMESTYSQYIRPDSRPYGSGERYPVYDIGWTDAILYCNARSRRDGLDSVYVYDSLSRRPVGSKPELKGFSINLSANGYRLPTEAEWEYACKGGTFTDYYWGKNYQDYQGQNNLDDVSMYAVWRINSWDLGTEHSNFGAHVVASLLPNPYGLYDMVGNVTEHCTDWYTDYDYGTFTDPFTPPVAGQPPMLRGGHWGSDVSFLRSANRTFDNSAYAYLLNGFRTVRRVE